MKKPSRRVMIGLVVALVALPSIGMAVSPTRSLILGMFPKQATLTLADKIDTNKSEVDAQVQALQATVNSQQAILDEQQRIKDEEQAKKEASEKQAGIDKIADDKKQACESAKSDCTSKIAKINGLIDSDESYIKQRKDDIKSRNKIIDNCNGASQCSKPYEDAIKIHEGLIKDKQKELDKDKDSLSKLTNGTCKDYKVAC